MQPMAIDMKCIHCGAIAELDDNGLCVSCFDNSVGRRFRKYSRKNYEAHRAEKLNYQWHYYRANREKILEYNILRNRRLRIK